MRPERDQHAMQYGLRPVKTVREVAKIMKVNRGVVFKTERAALKKIKLRLLAMTR